MRIQCTFPFPDVRRIVLIDLPGLGEIGPEAEQRHVQGLQNDTDVVVLLKRPSEQTSFWREEDAAALDLVERAKGDAIRTSDFLFVLNNQGPDDDPVLVSALDHSLAQDLNDSRPNDPIRILTADATDPDSATGGVLQPLLEHLGGNLPRLDRLVLADARRRCGDHARSLHRLLGSLWDRLKALGGEGDDFHEIVSRAADLRKALAVDLEEQVRLRLKRARGRVEDEAYIERVEGIYGGITDALATGFRPDREGMGRRAVRVDAG